MDFGIDLCHTHIGMAEELAGGVEVGAQCKHHGGEGVAGSMEGDVFVDAC